MNNSHNTAHQFQKILFAIFNKCVLSHLPFYIFLSLLSIPLFALPAILDSTLTLQAVDGGVNGAYHGKTYTVVFDDYAGVSIISPNNNGELINGDLGIDVSGEINYNVVIEMDLPDTLVGSDGNKMHITFPSSGPGSGVRLETGGFFNPNVTNTFYLGGGGTCGLRLGYVFTVPENVKIEGDSFVGQIHVNAYYTGLNSKKILQESSIVTLTVKVPSSQLILVPINGGVSGTRPDTTYAVKYNPYTSISEITPHNNGETTNSNVGINISGSNSAYVVVEMVLPNNIIGSHGSLLHVTFPSSGTGGGVRAETGGFYNPNVANTFNLGGGGTCNLRMGYVFTLPLHADPNEVFQTTILVRAMYTPLLNSKAALVDTAYYDSTYVTLTINMQPNGVNDGKIDVPLVTTLIQNYPNPFNPTTNIEFQIKDYEWVTLKIYDPLGKEVTSIVNEKLTPGAYTRSWDASGFPSGLYYYRLQTGDFSETKKLLLVR